MSGTDVTILLGIYYFVALRFKNINRKYYKEIGTK